MAGVKARDKIKQYFAKGKDSVEIVIAGKMSTGKSSLVNSLVGKQVAVEGHKPSTETGKIVCYTKAVDIPSDILKKTMLWCGTHQVWEIHLVMMKLQPKK